MPDSEGAAVATPLPLDRLVPDARVGVLIVHGIGTSNANYSEKFRQKLKSKLLKDHGIEEPHHVCLEEVFWGAVSKSGQTEVDINNQVFNKKTVGEKTLRSFVLRALADAAAYQDLDRTHREIAFKHCESIEPTGRYQMDITYDRVNDSVARSLSNLAARAGPNAPLIICAHSFGGQIVNSYFFDLESGVMAKRDAGKLVRGTRLERGETLAGIVTFGCNIPAFTFATDPAEVRPVTVPSKSLPSFAKALKDKGWKGWRNYFHKADVLGFPLGTINDAYRETADDVRLRFPTAPLHWKYKAAHGRYWTNKVMIADIAELVAIARKNPEAAPGMAADAALERVRAGA